MIRAYCTRIPRPTCDAEGPKQHSSIFPMPRLVRLLCHVKSARSSPIDPEHSSKLLSALSPTKRRKLILALLISSSNMHLQPSPCWKKMFASQKFQSTNAKQNSPCCSRRAPTIVPPTDIILGSSGEHLPGFSNTQTMPCHAMPC